MINHFFIIEQCKIDPFLFLSNVVQWSNMGDEKKKETKIEKKDEFGNTVEKTEIEEKEDDWLESYIPRPEIQLIIFFDHDSFTFNTNI